MFDSDAKEWKERWVEIEANKLKSGGQGSAKIVRRRDEPGGTAFFLKILNRQENSERRGRMFAEVASYRLLDHPNVPKPVESNSNFYGNAEFKLYLVSELINGMPLDQVPVPVTAEDAISALLRLCEILKHAHEREVVHRDIKLDNIMLRDKIISDVVLVDFGMSYHEASAGITPPPLEIGNRFLRLPELSSGSTLKRDPRSDVTFAAGILFYLLSGIGPAQLIDQEGKMPHQRPDAYRVLPSLAGLDIDRLLSLFDKAFDHRIDHRFQDAVALSGAIRDCVLSDAAAETMNLRAKMDRIKARVTAPSQVSIRKNMELLRQIIMNIRTTTGFVNQELGEPFDVYETGFAADVANLDTCYTIGLISKTHPNVAIKPTYHARIAGNEIVVSVDDLPIFRSDAKRVNYAAADEAARTYIISKIYEVTSERTQ